MDVPVTANGQFVDNVLLNTAITTIMGSMKSIGLRLHTYGLLNPTSMTITPASMVLTVQVPSPFMVLFGDGSLVAGHGGANYADSSTYTVNMAPLVPGSGSVTAYVVASKGTISQSLSTIIGPPPGHPDYDPTFAPYEFGLTAQDTLLVTGTTTAPDNSTTFELCRVTLSVGQSTITGGAIDKTHWQYGSAVLNPTGVTATSYPGATVTVGVDGRITGISSVAYGPLSGNNTWTGTNTFNAQVTHAGGLISNFIDASGGGGQIRLTSGNYGVILRNDGTSMSLLQTASGNQTAGFNALRPFYWNLASGAVVVDGTGAGVVMGGAAQVTGVLSIGGSGQFYLNPNNAGNQLLAFASNQYLEFVPSQGFILNTTGSITLIGSTIVTGTLASTGNGNFNGVAAGLLGDGNHGIQTVEGAYFDYSINPATPSFGGWFSPIPIYANNVISIVGFTYQNMYAAGFIISSDAAHKTDIQDLAAEAAVAFITDVPAKTFIRNGHTEAGFVAQDIQDTSFDHMIRTMEHHPDHPNSKQLGLNSTEPIAYHHTAIKVLLERIEALEKLVKDK
jgi:hypothetical protein